MVGTGRFELEPICGRERGKAERESAGEILSAAPHGAESKDLTPAPLAKLLFGALPLRGFANFLGCFVGRQR